MARGGKTRAAIAGGTGEPDGSELHQPAGPPDGAGNGGDGGAGSGGDSVIQLGDVAGNAGSGDSGSDRSDQPRAKRAYRKRGTGGSRPAGGAQEKLAVGKLLSDSLFMMHSFVAGVTGNANWSIDEGEAGKVGEAVARVAAHYVNIEVAAETADWINLAQVLGMVYGTRLMAASLDKRASRARNVTPAAQPGPQPMEASEHASEPAAPTVDKPPYPAPKGQMWASPGPGLGLVLMPAQ